MNISKSLKNLIFSNLNVISSSIQQLRDISENNTADQCFIQMSFVSAHFQSDRYIAPPNPIAIFSGSIPAEDKSTTSAFVPCLNGIVKVSDEVIDDNNRKCRISSLVYRFRDCCAVAKLIGLDNKSISTKIPVHLVRLANESHEENYHKNVFYELPQQTSDADMLFFLLLAIKRRIGLDAKKPSTKLSNEFFP